MNESHKPLRSLNFLGKTLFQKYRHRQLQVKNVGALSILVIVIFSSIWLDRTTKNMSLDYFFGTSGQMSSTVEEKIAINTWLQDPKICDKIANVCKTPEKTREPIEIVGNYLRFDFVLNSGIALGIPLGAFYDGLVRDVITVLGIFAVGIFLVISIVKTKKITIESIGYSCILGGAISNGYDRIVLGHVIDFLSIRWFAVCNVADIFITVGVIFVLYHTILADRKSMKHGIMSSNNSVEVKLEKDNEVKPEKNRKEATSSPIQKN